MFCAPISELNSIFEFKCKYKDIVPLFRKIKIFATTVLHLAEPFAFTYSTCMLNVFSFTPCQKAVEKHQTKSESLNLNL